MRFTSAIWKVLNFIFLTKRLFGAITIRDIAHGPFGAESKKHEQLIRRGDEPVKHQ